MLCISKETELQMWVLQIFSNTMFISESCNTIFSSFRDVCRVLLPSFSPQGHEFVGVICPVLGFVPQCQDRHESSSKPWAWNVRWETSLSLQLLECLSSSIWPQSESVFGLLGLVSPAFPLWKDLSPGPQCTPWKTPLPALARLTVDAAKESLAAL